MTRMDRRLRCNSLASRGASRRPVDPFGDPKLDQRLTGHPEAAGFAVEGFDHPHRKIDIDTLEQEIGTSGLGPVDLARHILARVEFFIELTRFHKNRPPLSRTGGPK